jgi:putative FmdB family regulatory protein
MPIYEYECLKCGNHLEVMQKMSDEPLTKCPKCKANKLEKIFSQTAFQFKGSGWYVTDYSNKGKAADKKADKAEKSDKADKTEKAEQSEKTEKADKVEKTEKADKSAKKEPAAQATSS